MVFPEVSLLDLYCIFSENRNSLSLLYAGNCDMGFYVDFEALKLCFLILYKISIPMICNMTTFEKNLFERSFLVRKIEGHNRCAISPVAQGYQNGIRLI